MQSEWHARLDFLLVLVAIVVITLMVFKLLGPQIYALTAYVIDQVGNLVGGLLNQVTGGSSRSH